MHYIYWGARYGVWYDIGIYSITAVMVSLGILGSMAKGGAELITRALNSDLIENASNAFKKIGGVLERLGPIIGAVATGFVLLSPILGPLFWIGGKVASVFGFLISSVFGTGKAISGLVGGVGKLGGKFGGLIGKLKWQRS